MYFNEWRTLRDHMLYAYFVSMIVNALGSYIFVTLNQLYFICTFQIFFLIMLNKYLIHICIKIFIYIHISQGLKLRSGTIG